MKTKEENIENGRDLVERLRDSGELGGYDIAFESNGIRVNISNHKKIYNADELEKVLEEYNLLDKEFVGGTLNVIKASIRRKFTEAFKRIYPRFSEGWYEPNFNTLNDVKFINGKLELTEPVKFELPKNRCVYLWMDNKTGTIYKKQ